MALSDASYILLTKDLNLVVVLVYIFFLKNYKCSRLSRGFLHDVSIIGKLAGCFVVLKVKNF